MYTLPVEDLQEVSQNIVSLWPQNKVFLLTGATGFFGRWLVESIAFLEDKKISGNKYHIVSRKSSEELFKKIPVLQRSCFQLHQMDLQSDFTMNLHCDYVLHGATDVALAKDKDVAVSMKGIQGLLQCLKNEKAARFLYLSSGGVYAAQEEDRSRSEVDSLQDQPSNSYVAEKIQSEKYLFSQSSRYSICVARCFSFVGPFADSKMAVMDMIGHKARQKPIEVQSPLVKRSFMYPTDLVFNLLRLLITPNLKFNLYNVGSSFAISLQELAQWIESLKSPAKEVAVVHQMSTKALAGRYYYPNIDRLTSEFDNVMSVDLNSALAKTLNFEMKVLQK